MQLESKLTWGYRWYRLVNAWWLFLIIGVLLAFLVGAPGSRKITEVNSHTSFEPIAGGAIAWLVAKGLDYAEQHWGSYGVTVNQGNDFPGVSGPMGGGGGGGL